MKTLFNLLLVSALSMASLPSQAEESLEVFTEAERIMVVWSPSGNILGRAHVYTCETCEPSILTFNQSTQLRIKGANRPIEDLKLIVDGAGLVKTNTATPNSALAFDLY